MHIALIIDKERLLLERDSINRLMVGLVTEGIRVTRIVPDSLDHQWIEAGESRVSLVHHLDTPMPTFPLLRSLRCRRLAETMHGSIPDAFHAFGITAWDLGRDLADAMDRPVILETCSPAESKHLPTGRAARNVAAYVCPTDALAGTLSTRVTRERVLVVPPGVRAPDSPTELFRNPEDAISLAIIGSGRDVPAYEVVLTALGSITADYPQLNIFLELPGRRSRSIWRIVERLGLLGNVSCLDHAAGLRRHLTRCDAMLIPEEFGELRILMLDAMAAGLPIIAPSDPCLSMLEDQINALLMTDGRSGQWERNLRRLLSDPEEARALGRMGRDRMQCDYTSTRQVARMIDAYEQILEAEILHARAS